MLVSKLADKDSVLQIKNIPREKKTDNMSAFSRINGAYQRAQSAYKQLQLLLKEKIAVFEKPRPVQILVTGSKATLTRHGNNVFHIRSHLISISSMQKKSHNE